MKTHSLIRVTVLGLAMLLGATLVLAVQGCVNDSATTASQDMPEQTVLETQEDASQSAPATARNSEVGKTPSTATIAQNTLLNKASDPESVPRTFNPDDERVMKTFATIGLYYLLQTLQPGFELGLTVPLEVFNEALDRHWVDLGFLMRSSFELAAELRECLDTNSLVREEIFFMISGAVEGELVEAYPNILPDIGQLLGLSTAPNAADIIDAYTNNFLQEISIEGGRCKEIASKVDIECAIFRAFPEL